MSKLEEFLMKSNLSDEAKGLIREAWEDEKQVIAADIRDEMKTRFNEDFNKIVNGVNTMMESVINEEMKSVYDEKRKLVEDRVRIRKSLGGFSKFANGVLAEEVKKMRNEKTELNECIKNFIDFSNKILAEEVNEFQNEKRQLIETRVKLISEGRKQINEARKNFISRTAETAAKFIQESTEENIAELRSDILEAKQNRFGRQLYEAFEHVFHAKQYNENKILRQMNEAIKVRENAVSELKVKLEESSHAVEEANRKIRIMEDTQQRAAIISELTKPLTASQKRIMEDLLKTSPTERLSEDFSKYHKAVLKESAAKTGRPAVNNKAKASLNESKVITGNRPQTGLPELNDDDVEFLNALQKNAGIFK